MKFGMLYLFENLAGKSARCCGEMDLMSCAEDPGFDSVWAFVNPRIVLCFLNISPNITSRSTGFARRPR